jgi:hypothetical protein
MRRDDYDVFCDKFKPVTTEENGNGPELRKFHWAGKDLEDLKKYPDNQIWTMLDCDGKIYIVPGWHYVNRMDYLITEVPWKEGQRDYKY